LNTVASNDTKLHPNNKFTCVGTSTIIVPYRDSASKLNKNFIN